MNEVLTTPEARPASCGSTSPIAASRTGLKAIPAPAPSSSIEGSTSATKEPPTGARENSARLAAASSRPTVSGGADAEPHHQPVGDPQRAERHHHAGRQEGEADLEGVVPEHPLQVERGQEEPGEHRGGPEHADDLRHRRRCAARRAAAAPAGGRSVPRTPTNAASRTAPRRAGRGSGRRPSRRRCRRRCRRPRASGRRSPAPRRRRRAGRALGDLLVGGQHAAGAEPDGDADRRRSPGRSSATRAARSARRRARTPTAPPPDITKPKTPIAFARSPGSENRPMISASATAETAAPPRPWIARPATSSPDARRQAAGDGGGRERHDARREDPLVAEQVTEPAGQQQEAAEGQQVGVDHPRQRRGPEKPRSDWMDGSATFTMLWSSTIIRSPRHST